jgi:hypothetical protein
MTAAAVVVNRTEQNDVSLSVCCDLASAAEPFFGFAYNSVLQSLRSAVSEARVIAEIDCGSQIVLKDINELGPKLYIFLDRFVWN